MQEDLSTDKLVAVIYKQKNKTYVNLLFATVLVLLIVAPGLTFFRAFYSDKFSIRYSRLTITDQVFRSIVPSITVQILAIILINKFSAYVVRLDVLGVLFLGSKDDKTLKSCFEIIDKSLNQVFFYHIVMITMGGIAGWLTRIFVRQKKYDRLYRWLRFDNKWFYLLSGESVEFGEYKEEPFTEFSDAKKIKFVVLDILTEIEDGNVLYTGILVDYELEEDGGLKSLQLTAVRRKYLTTNKSINDSEVESEDEKSSKEYYAVSGNLLVIPFSQVLNINISYWLKESTNDISTDIEAQE